jgi:hypothetical protein
MTNSFLIRSAIKGSAVSQTILGPESAECRLLNAERLP